MRETSEAGWWRRTEIGAAVALAATGLVCAFLFILPAGAGTVFGLPTGDFLRVLAAPLLVLAAAFWFIGRQRALDRRFDVAED